MSNRAGAADAWDGERIVTRFDAEAETWMFVAIHSTRLGPAAGGTRLAQYPDRDAARRDVQRLSAGMTDKWAVAGFPCGGGKAVLATPRDLRPPEREGLLRRYGALVAELAGAFTTGPDLGTSSADMDVVAETGAPYVFGRSRERGGVGGSGGWTALGVFVSMEVVCRRLFGTPSLAGRSVLVQGVGGVGRPLLERLAAAGAQVRFSESDAERARVIAEQTGVESVAPGAVLESACDVFVPCAFGGVLHEESITRLRCRAVVGAANNQLAAAEDSIRLATRGILYAPDFVVNAGGAIAVAGMEAMGWTPDRAEREVRGIGATLERVLALADSAGIDPDSAARRLARERLAAAEPRLA